MSTWIYKQTERTLWTVGHYWNDGAKDVWEPSSDHGTAEEAAERVRILNGGPATIPDVAPDGSLRVSTEVAGALAAIADVLTEHTDPLDVMDAREEAVALLALLASGSWGADTAQREVREPITAEELADCDDGDDEPYDLAVDPDAMESMYPRDREDGEGIHRPSYGD